MVSVNARQRVLVIEDDVFIAMLLEDILLDIDEYAVDLFADFDEGLKAARTGTYAFAVLDVDLNGVRSFPIADVLSERRIPFAFSTGYGTAGLDPAYADHIVLPKPFQAEELRTIVAKLLRATGHVQRLYSVSKSTVNGIGCACRTYVSLHFDFESAIPTSSELDRFFVVVAGHIQ